MDKPKFLDVGLWESVKAIATLALVGVHENGD
jgi:hypothetical protein